MRLIRFFALIITLACISVTLPAQTAKKAPGKSAAATADSLVDVNHATAAELKAVPGIGEAYSAAIIKGRPYANKTQLKTRNIIPNGVYEKIKDKIIAKQ